MDFKGFRCGDGSQYSPCGLLPSAAPRADITEERCQGTPVYAISVPRGGHLWDWEKAHGGALVSSTASAGPSRADP